MNWGVDVSSIQNGDNPGRSIDWAKLVARGCAFAYVRCGYGNEGPDKWFERNANEARDAGLKVGAYHVLFPIPKCDPEEQADEHYAAMKGLAGDLPPMGDLEWPLKVAKKPRDTWAFWGCDGAQIRAWTLRWLGRMRTNAGDAGVYSFPDYLSVQDGIGSKLEPSLAAYPLWLANYPSAYQHNPPPDGTKFPSYLPWVTSLCWQFTGGGLVLPGGAAVDGDVWNGDLPSSAALLPPIYVEDDPGNKPLSG